MNRNHGLTLIEVLVSISIIAMIFAILAPVFQQARESSRITSAVSFMHQIGKHIAMYRSDWEAGGSYSDAYEVGLPAWHYIFADVISEGMGLGTTPLASPCGYRSIKEWENTRHAPDYIWAYLPWDLPGYSPRILQKYKENTLLVFDPWCNPSGTEWSNPYTEKRAIGLLLNGQVINRKKAGLPNHQDWWAPPEP